MQATSFFQAHLLFLDQRIQQTRKKGKKKGRREGQFSVYYWNKVLKCRLPVFSRPIYFSQIREFSKQGRKERRKEGGKANSLSSAIKSSTFIFGFKILYNLINQLRSKILCKMENLLLKEEKAMFLFLFFPVDQKKWAFSNART